MSESQNGVVADERWLFADGCVDVCVIGCVDGFVDGCVDERVIGCVNQ